MVLKKSKDLKIGLFCVIAFICWTYLIISFDVKPVGVNETDIGFATLNTWFRSLIGVNMTLYYTTDWAGLIPVFVCFMFGVIGFLQLIKRKSLFKVDSDILVLGVYYVIVIFSYLIFEMIPINYRPILINGFMEASYPSSTTLLVLSVIPTLVFQADRRLMNINLKKLIKVISFLFVIFMVAGRLISGVHWLTDIIGSILLSMGLFHLYKATVLRIIKK